MSLYPGSRHVRRFGLESADDETVWNFARQQGFPIVSKDSDFHQRSFLFGFPPKVIWLRLGNCTTTDIVDVLRTRRADVHSFCEDSEQAFLILS